MTRIINVSIDLTKVKKDEHLVKGKYLNIVIGENRNGVDQYENTHWVALKKDKDSTEETLYLGNGRDWDMVNKHREENSGSDDPNESAPSNDDDDLPF